MENQCLDLEPKPSALLLQAKDVLDDRLAEPEQEELLELVKKYLR